MTDILERLENPIGQGVMHREAAEEIRRLRYALQEIYYTPNIYETRGIARRALVSTQQAAAEVTKCADQGDDKPEDDNGADQNPH